MPYIPLKNPAVIAAFIAILFFGWHVRRRFFEAAAHSRPLRLTVIVVNGTCVLILIAMLFWHFFIK